MGNAIGSLIMLGKGRGQDEEEDSVLLSEEHSLILTCCWVSVKVGTPPHCTGERAPTTQPLGSSAHLGHSLHVGTSKGKSLPLPWSCRREDAATSPPALS